MVDATESVTRSARGSIAKEGTIQLVERLLEEESSLDTVINLLEIMRL